MTCEDLSERDNRIEDELTHRRAVRILSLGNQTGDARWNAEGGTNFLVGKLGNLSDFEVGKRLCDGLNVPAARYDGCAFGFSGPCLPRIEFVQYHFCLVWVKFAGDGDNNTGFRTVS